MNNNNNNNTLIDMLYSIKDSIGLHASSGACLGILLEKLKIPKFIGLTLIKNIMTNDNDNNNDDEWKYSLMDKPEELNLYDEIFFNDRITDINKIIIHSPQSQWWKSFGLHSSDVINVLESESMLLKITELLALAGTNGIIVTEFSKLLNIPFKVYHYFLDRLVALDIISKRMIIPIKKQETNITVPLNQRIKSGINIVHLMRFSRLYNPMIHYATIAYDERTTNILKNVVQSIYINDKNNEKLRNAKKLHKQLNIRKHEASAILKVIRSEDSDHENEDDKEVEQQKGKKEQKVDETVYPFNSYLRNHTLYEQARLLIVGTPGGVSSQAFRTVLRLDHKKSAKLIDKFKTEFKYPSQEKLQHYNHTTFILPHPLQDTIQENKKELPDDFKGLTHREMKEKIIMIVMNTPGKGIEVSREMTELSNTRMADVALPFKFDRKQVQKTCQNLHDMKKVVLYELPLPEGILLYKLPTLRIIALPEVFEDRERVHSFMLETIERLKPGAKKGKKKIQMKPPTDEVVPKVTAKPQIKKKAKAPSAAKKKIVKSENESDSYGSSSSSSSSEEETSSESESIIEIESDKDSISSNEDIDDKIDQLFKMTNQKRVRDISDDDDDESDNDFESDNESNDERKRKRFKGVDESDDDGNNKNSDEWSPLEEAYALQYHLLNCLQRNLLKKNATTLLPWNSIIIRNMDTVDLSYIHGRSFTKAQMDNVGKKWPMIKNHLFRLLKTQNTIRKILSFVLCHINPLDPELVELLNGVLDSETYNEKRHGQVSSLERAAMSKAIRVCTGEKGCLDVINDFSSSIKSRVENELLTSQLIRSRAQEMVNTNPGIVTDNSYEISDDKLLSYDRAILHYNLLNSEKVGQNIISTSEILNVNSTCTGELHLMNIDKKEKSGPVFRIKLEDRSSNVLNEANSIALAPNIKITGRYPELNRLDVNLKVFPTIVSTVPTRPESTIETHHSSNDLFDHYEWLIEVVRTAGNVGINTIQVIKLLRDKLNKDVNIRAFDTIIRKGIDEKQLIQIHDFIEQDITLENENFNVTPSLLIDIQFEYLYRVYDGEDGTCPWMNENGVTNTTFLNKLQANMKALLTNLPGADFTVLHSYFPYLTKYQMEILLKTFTSSGLIRQQIPKRSIIINNPFESISYSTEPCYFLTS